MDIDWERMKSCEDFVRRTLAHLGEEVDDAILRRAAVKVAKALPPYGRTRRSSRRNSPLPS